jgi:hypothetical protein
VLIDMPEYGGWDCIQLLLRECWSSGSAYAGEVPPLVADDFLSTLFIVSDVTLVDVDPDADADALLGADEPAWEYTDTLTNTCAR